MKNTFDSEIRITLIGVSGAGAGLPRSVAAHAIPPAKFPHRASPHRRRPFRFNSHTPDATHPTGESPFSHG